MPRKGLAETEAVDASGSVMTLMISG